MSENAFYENIETQINSLRVNSLDAIIDEIHYSQDILDTTTDLADLEVILPEIVDALNQRWHKLGLLNKHVAVTGEVFIPEQSDEDNDEDEDEEDADDEARQTTITLRRLDIDNTRGVSKGFHVFTLPEYFEGERFERLQVVHILLTEPEYDRDLAHESKVSYHLYGLPKDIIIFSETPDVEYLSRAIPDIIEDIDMAILNPTSKKDVFRDLSEIRLTDLSSHSSDAHEHLAGYINSLLNFKAGMPYVIKNSKLIFDILPGMDIEEGGEEGSEDDDDDYMRLGPDIAKTKFYAYIGGIAIIDDFTFKNNTIYGLPNKRLALQSLMLTKRGLRPVIVPLSRSITIKPLV